MVIETTSPRLALAARICRLFPPVLSGRIFWRLYPSELGFQERAGFVASSSLANVRFRLSTEDYIATAFALRGFFEWRNVLIANSVCSRGDVIIDVGSNIGTETILFSRVVGASGKVVAFEPLPRNFRILEDLIRENGLSNIELHREAVSDHSGTLQFQPPDKEGNFGVGRIAQDQAGQDLIQVNCVVLDELFEAGKLKAPRLVVMDVEGFELDVLRGARRLLRAVRPFLILEVSAPLLENRGLHAKDIGGFLADQDYRAYQIARWGLIPAPFDVTGTVNWFCVSNDQDPDRVARRISRRMMRAAFLPLIRGLNPAVVANGD